MISSKNLKIIFILLVSSIFLNSCGGKLPGADARKYDPDPKKRVAKNLEEGEGSDFQKLLVVLKVEFLNLQALMSYGEHH